MLFAEIEAICLIFSAPTTFTLAKSATIASTALSIPLLNPLD
jgi:hypothetical protein